LHIRKSLPGDIKAITEIYREARRFMRSTGNLTQWTGSYPGEESAYKDMLLGRGYVCEDDYAVIAAFCFYEGVDPSYARIHGGCWAGDSRYGVIHSVAVLKPGERTGGFCVDYCLDNCRELRADTHRSNLPMRRLLTKKGFVYRGMIYLPDGGERMAYSRKGSLAQTCGLM